MSPVSPVFHAEVTVSIGIQPWRLGSLERQLSHSVGLVNKSQSGDIHYTIFYQFPYIYALLKVFKVDQVSPLYLWGITPGVRHHILVQALSPKIFALW